MGPACCRRGPKPVPSPATPSGTGLLRLSAGESHPALRMPGRCHLARCPLPAVHGCPGAGPGPRHALGCKDRQRRTWVQVCLNGGPLRGAQGVSWPPECKQSSAKAAPPSSCPVTSAQWTQCVPAASPARITVAWAGTLSFLISPLLPPLPLRVCFPAG